MIDSPSTGPEDDFENSIGADEDRPIARKKKVQYDSSGASGDSTRRPKRGNAAKGRTRKASKAPPRKVKDDDYEQDDDDDEDVDVDGSLEEDTEPQLSDHSSDANMLEARPKRSRGRRNPVASTDDEQPVRKLRERTTKVNYSMVIPLEEAPKRAGTRNFGAKTAANGGFLMDISVGANALADPNMPNMPDSDSDDDPPDHIKEMRKEATTYVTMANGATSRAKKHQAGPSTATVAAGTVGRYNPEAARADADPLGVDLNVTFDQVGGLDGHINQLKEMVALPLLYPELFQQFGITPPRGVLFHGPPGTGKTLLARALAASCSSSTQKIAFFMRKGADCLSKWVGEAERQLRLLFEEAKNAQPSIIFFDEIDGLAPVRSSKQDQVHSSLVATLLALMDGMDGRGQVIVIGATNRPDSVDPALRRPGRFDREFYFPLPNKEARKKIISINTRKWEPPLEDRFLDELSALTKGYGGADLRALCTEAALNAIQRRYPQVYKTNDRLQLDASSIQVQARDFMASVRKIVPSSARSAASSAQPLPPHLEPLLAAPLEEIKKVVSGLIPSKSTRSVLEEAEWEDDNEDGTFGRELLLQSFETLRVYRPRLLIHGQKGLGQRFFGAALLHHLEGYHVQNLDIATLLGQSTATIETMLVQMFVEAKRHQPSVLYIPGLSQWASVLSSSAKATFTTLLDSLTPSEPVIIIAFMDEPLNMLDEDVKNWFGRMGKNLIELLPPNKPQRTAYFSSILDKISLPPNQFPDALPKRKRILEDLPLAAPLPPPPPSAAAVAEQEAKDQTLREFLAYRLHSVLMDLKKKHNRKSTITARDALARWEALVALDKAQAEAELEIVQLEAEKSALAPQPVLDEQANLNGNAMDIDAGPSSIVPVEVVASEDVASEHVHVMESAEVNTHPPIDATDKSDPKALPKPERQKPHWVDFELMQEKLMSKENGYLSLRMFQRDIERMKENVHGAELDVDRRGRASLMYDEAVLLIKDHFQDEQQKLDFERMAAREFAKRQMKERKSNRSTGSSPTGIRSSARINGKIADFRVPDIMQLERNAKKRSRDGSVDSSNASESRANKRNKSDDHTMLNGVQTASVVQDTNLQHDASVQPLQDHTFTKTPHDTSMPYPVQNKLASILNPTPFTPSPAPTSLPRIQPPPLFTVPHDTFIKLQHCLTSLTEHFTVEDLEQLRAMALQIIWNHRADWDRTLMLMRLLNDCYEFVTKVTH